MKTFFKSIHERFSFWSRILFNSWIDHFASRSDQDYQVETVFSIKVHYYPDPSPNEQKSNQEDFCLSLHHHHHKNFFDKLFQTEHTWRLAHLPSFCELVLTGAP